MFPVMGSSNDGHSIADIHGIPWDESRTNQLDVLVRWIVQYAIDRRESILGHRESCEVSLPEMYLLMCESQGTTFQVQDHIQLAEHVRHYRYLLVPSLPTRDHLCL